MKKKLEGELISIAHRVLKLKNRSETVLLQREAKKLYEQLTVLRFYEENFETLKNDISPEQLEEKLEQMATVAAIEATDLEEKVAEVIQPVDEVEVVEQTIPQPEEVETEEIAPEEIAPEEIAPEETVEEEIVAQEIPSEIVEESEEVYATAEDINKLVAEMSSKKNVSDEVFSTTDKVEEAKSNASQQIAFEDFLGSSYSDPEFVRVEDTPKEVEKAADLVFEKKEEHKEVEEVVEVKKENFNFSSQTKENQEVKTKSLNDRLTSGISFGLNDRIAFEKKLFGGSADDFNRVVSQLNTFDSFEEASSFIADFVKPDYKNWEGQEEYETRFLEIVEKKFN
jgi:hypothetical protein